MTHNYLEYKDFLHSFTKSDEEPGNCDVVCTADLCAVLQAVPHAGPRLDALRARMEALETTLRRGLE